MARKKARFVHLVWSVSNYEDGLLKYVPIAIYKPLETPEPLTVNQLFKEIIAEGEQETITEPDILLATLKAIAVGSEAV